jgi:SpoIID/LytB domain protein
MDQYVMGVVPYEMPASWHPEAVKAQAIAARTYATWSRSQNVRRHYQICDTTACQVYNGTDGEDRRSNAAVRATRREILRYDGKPAFTQFSSSSGGWTARGSVPYLPAQRDPYDGWEGNGVHSWSVRIDASRLERSHPGIGTLRRIRVTNRDGNGDWQGRVQSLVLDGTKGNTTISGDSFRWAFGLRSNWFTIEPTPITQRWARLGGVKSRLGTVRSREWAIAHGSNQLFKKGRIFYSKATGARELYGPVLRAYNKVGGPRSKLGFPRTAVRNHGKNRFALFQNGGIYRRPGKPGVVLTGAIHKRYLAADKWRSGLGLPDPSNYRVKGGERVDFRRGYIVWKRTSGRTQLVRR